MENHIQFGPMEPHSHIYSGPMENHTIRLVCTDGKSHDNIYSVPMDNHTTTFSLDRRKTTQPRSIFWNVHITKHTLETSI
jgi:hypothetical protein